MSSVAGIPMVDDLAAFIQELTSTGAAKLESDQEDRLRGLWGTIATVAPDYDLNPFAVAAIARWESNYEPTAVGPPIELPDGGVTHAHGLMQVTESNLRNLGSWENRYDPETNLHAGCEVLRYFLQTEGDWMPALASYGGFKTVDPSTYQFRIFTLWGNLQFVRRGDLETAL